MRKLITIFLVFVCVLLSATAAWGGLIISCDENGNGTFDNGTSIIPLDYGVEGTLYYVLPITMVGGDLAVMEPGTTAISDVLRFSGNRIYVYSDLTEAGELPPYDLADVGIPPLGNNVVYVDEQGVEGKNGVTYTPTSGQPGSNTNPGGTPRTYNFTSDVPEPATIALLGLGALSLIRRKR